jgi:hypothetical protein
MRPWFACKKAGIAPWLAGLVRYYDPNHDEALLDPMIDLPLGVPLVTAALHLVRDDIEREQQRRSMVAGTNPFVQAHYAKFDARKDRLDSWILREEWIFNLWRAR